MLPGSEGRARRLASIAGACRFVWNELLDQQEQLHTMARMCGGRTPSPTFFTMAKAFTDLPPGDTVAPGHVVHGGAVHAQAPGGCLAPVLRRDRRPTALQAPGP